MKRRIIHLCLFWAGLLQSVVQAAPPAAVAPPRAPAIPAGTVFHFVGMIYLAGRIEFRDAGGDLFPNYWYEAKFGDVRGRMVFDPQKPDRKIPVKTDARITYNFPKGRSDMGGLTAANLLGMSMELKIEFTIKGRVLELKKVADKEIAVVVRSRAFTEETILKGTKKKTLAEAGALPLPEDGKTAR